jgi:xanthine/uracil permease
MFDWKLKPAADGTVVAPDERLPWPQTTALGMQHVVAMFGANVLCPILMGFDSNVCVLMTGAGTLIFFAVTAAGCRASSAHRSRSSRR